MQFFLFILLSLLKASICTPFERVSEVQDSPRFNVSETVLVPLPLAKPIYAKKISKDFVSFSIEMDRFVDWVGELGSRNNYSYQIWENMKDVTGSPPAIRIGGDTEDRTTYDPSVEYTSNIYPAATVITPYQEATNVTLGSKFFQTTKNALPSTLFTVGLNLKNYSLSNTLKIAEAVVETWKGFTESGDPVLELIEIGNEPDLYSPTYRTYQNWSAEEYKREWTPMANEVAAILPSDWTTTYQLGAYAEVNDQPGSVWFEDWTAAASFLNGIQYSTGGEKISTVSQHHYFGAYCSGTGAGLSDLLNKQYIKNNVSAALPDLMAVQNQGLTYLFGETNSIACHGAPGVSNSATGAIWLVNYALFSGSLGISRMHFHHGVGYKYNFFQPIALNVSILDATPLDPPQPPQVQAPYYGAMIILSAISNASSTYITELNIRSLNVSGYAFWDSDSTAVKRAVLIGSEAYLSGNGTIASNAAASAGAEEGVRSSSMIYFNQTALTTTPTSGESVTVPTKIGARRFTPPSADSVSNLTFGGVSWETSDGKASGEAVIDWSDWDEGVEVAASEVVLVYFE